ncbi:MAG: DUF4350 domain-containing protein [Chromatiales bacterium]|nr:DUF4350 domain-containing protein [Chromatiales bacterium]
MRTQTNRWFLFALLALSMAAVGYAIYNNIRIKTERIHVGLRGEAARNPLLAVQRLLERHQVPVNSVNSLARIPWPPAADAIVVLPGERQTVSKARAAELLEWVEQGGRLLVEPRFSDSDKDLPVDPLLDPYQVTGRRIDTDETQIALLVDDFPSTSPLELHLPADRWVDWDGIEPDGVLWNEDTPLMLRFDRGDGYLLVMSDSHWFENDAIGEQDHAEMFWWLSHADSGPSQVWLVYQDGYPPLWALLWRYAPALILSLGLLAVVWLISSAQRFGPLMQAPVPGRRSLLEHLSAAGELYWRGGRRDLLLQGARAGLQQRIERRHPDLAVLAEPQRIARLAAISGLPQTEVLTALTAQDPRRPEEFVQIVKTLQVLRKQL